MLGPMFLIEKVTLVIRATSRDFYCALLAFAPLIGTFKRNKISFRVFASCAELEIFVGRFLFLLV